MITVTYYFRNIDDPDRAVLEHLKVLGKELDYLLVDICLEEHTDIKSRLQEDATSLQIGPYRLHFPFDDLDIRIAVKSFQDKQAYKELNLTETEKNKKGRVKITATDRFSYWLSRNYIWFISAILALFIGLPFLAPVLMKYQHKNAGQTIYNFYSVFCHQLSFRSYFLFGEQPFYARNLANIPILKTYEDVTGKSALDISFARTFVGNDIVGYKVGLCERDIAIYGSLLLAGILFQLTGKKIKSIPWYWWIIFAIIPIALDGGSQLFSLGGNWPAWLPVRESTPLLRTITGALFGLGTAWYVYPMMEESMKDIRTSMAIKMTIKEKLLERESA
jgi:uncharacterized membrane protein